MENETVNENMSRIKSPLYLTVWTLNNVEWWQDFLHKKKMPRRAVLIFANSTRNQKKKKKNEKKL